MLRFPLLPEILVSGGQSIIALVPVSPAPFAKGTVGDIHLSQRPFDSQRGLLDHPDDLHLLRLGIFHGSVDPDSKPRHVFLRQVPEACRSSRV